MRSVLVTSRIMIRSSKIIVIIRVLCRVPRCLERRPGRGTMSVQLRNRHFYVSTGYLLVLICLALFLFVFPIRINIVGQF